MESTLKSSSRTSGRPPLIAKSPSSDKTLITGTGSGSDPRSRGGRFLLLFISVLQSASGLLMIVLGVLCAVYGLAMSRLGGGVSGGLVALLAGLMGTVAALIPYTTSLYYTIYLALCLVSMAVNTLVLVLTLTAVVRDAQIDVKFLPPEESDSIWAGQWCGIGLLSATSFHLLCTLLSLPISCRRACQGGKHLSEEVSDTKQSMIRSWLGQQNNNLVLVPPHLIKDVSQCSPSPVYPAIGVPLGVPVPYPRTVTPMRVPPGHHVPQRPRKSNRHGANNHNHPHYNQQAPQAAERPKRKEKKKREITEEELEKTYTGLDREIAEEFISIAMQPSSNSSSNSSSNNTNSSAASGSLRSSSEDTTVSSSRALRP